MATRTEIPVSLIARNYRDLPATPGTITKVEFDKKERTQNAIKTFGILIALTFCAIFVPIAHFFLVPVLLIASFVIALDKLNEAARSEGGSGECPRCHQPVKIVPSKFSERLTDTCGACHEDVEINVAPSSASS
jgi:hypothetical protein